MGYDGSAETSQYSLPGDAISFELYDSDGYRNLHPVQGVTINNFTNFGSSIIESLS